MAIPQLRSEGNDTGGTTASFTVDFTSGGLLTWAANDIIEIALATDGYVPTLSTANGFALAQDPQGNTASVTTNAGTAGTADCGMFVFWKRATGSNTTSDPPPVVAAATNGGTCWCLEPNAYSGARTTGTPYHLIATAILGTASTTVAPPSVTPTLANSLVMTRVASANDDQAFSNWTMTGSSGPAAGAPSSGWHNGSGNACAFTGADGGYATAAGARSGTTTFAASTKQAQITLVLASLPEVTAALDDAVVMRPLLAAPAMPLWQMPADSEMPVTTPSGVVEDDAGIWTPAGPAPAVLIPAVAVDELPAAAAPAVLDDDYQPLATPVLLSPMLRVPTTDDELPGAAASIVDDGDRPAAILALALVQPVVLPVADELPSVGVALDEDQPLGRLAVQAPERLGVPPATDELPVATTTATVAAAGGIQRSNDAPPATGTMTTGTIPAWATSTAYVVDASVSGISRVQNGGSIYQCSADGTSASSGGGPSGTSTAIGDGAGALTWYFVGPVLATNTPAGCQVLACVMRGTQSVTPGGAITPTDNDSGSFTLIVNTTYAGFPTSFAGVWRRSTASNIKTGYAVSGQFGSVGSGQGDEMTLGWLALQGVVVGAPHAFSQVERASPTSGSVTAASITTTVRTLVVSFWFGNGGVQSVGATDTAAPAGGLTLVANASFPLAIAAPGYIQDMVAWRIADPGTFAESWTAVTSEGAQLVTVAFEIPGGALDDATMLPSITWTRAPALDARSADDELPVAAVAALDDDQPITWPVVVAAGLWSPRTADDDLPVAATVDDVAAVSSTPVVAPPTLAYPVSGDEIAPAAPVVIDEDAQLGVPLPLTAQPAAALATGDDLPIAAGIVDEDAPQPAVQQPLAALAMPAPSDDGLPLTAPSIVDDDAPAPQPMAAPLGVWFAPQAADEIPVQLALEDATWTFTVSWAAPPAPAAVSLADELPIAASVLDDDPGVRYPIAPITWPMRAWSADDELVPFVAPPPIVDEDQPRAPPPTPRTELPWFVVYDEVLAQSVTAPIDGDEVQIIILNMEVAVKLLESTFRQNSTHRPLQGIAFNAIAKIDFPAEFPGGITLKMVGPVTIAGPATGDASGVWSYAWQPGDLATPGVYAATITATDGSGQPETFPTSTNMEITVLATL